MIGMTGLEPATSASQTQRSTKLSYIPPTDYSGRNPQTPGRSHVKLSESALVVSEPVHQGSARQPPMTEHIFSHFLNLRERL